ncbi:hypothetical protein HU830_08380 [Lactobacillus sp. DCY120]|uniref:Secreted protein n=1 Tax=Bombilactobacillus apium TaxID=2675299 RepID=A0A850RCX8_9LACO|nr:hypothetical protein [Bombilactobacillus apium]NVY97136.1 hypothetical protein [Bombilactobacillus apium]
MKNIGKKIIGGFLAVITVLNVIASTGTMAVADIKEPDTAIEYNQKKGKIEVSSEFAEESGMSKKQEQMLISKFDKLSDSEKEQILNNNNARVAPLVLWAAKVLASAGLGWLAKKLLDYGAARFCRAYRNSNWATKKVCAVIG